MKQTQNHPLECCTIFDSLFSRIMELKDMQILRDHKPPKKSFVSHFSFNR